MGPSWNIISYYTAKYYTVTQSILIKKQPWRAWIKIMCYHSHPCSCREQYSVSLPLYRNIFPDTPSYIHTWQVLDTISSHQVMLSRMASKCRHPLSIPTLVDLVILDWALVLVPSRAQLDMQRAWRVLLELLVLVGWHPELFPSKQTAFFLHHWLMSCCWFDRTSILQSAPGVPHIYCLPPKAYAYGLMPGMRL